MPKSPTLAAVLNFFLWGLGYLYLGKKRTFGAFLFVGNMMLVTSLAFSVPAVPLIVEVLVFSGNVAISVAFAWDALKIAKGISD